MVKSKQKLQKVDTEDIASSSQSNLLTIENVLSMQESLQENNLETCNDKSTCCNESILPTMSSQTSVQESTSEDQGCKPFWDSQLEDYYKLLWLPTETDYQDLDLNSSNTSLRNVTLISKSSQMFQHKNQCLNLQKTYLPLLQSLQQDTTVPESIKYCRKIRIYPNDIQTKVFNKCIGAARYFYNKSVAYLNKHGLKGNMSRAALRPQIMKSDEEVTQNKNDPEYWQVDVPYDTRQEAINDAISAFKACCSNLRNGNINHFSVGYKSKKRRCRESFRVNKKALNIIKRTIMPQAMKREFEKHKNCKNRKKKFNNKLRIRKRDIEKYEQDGTLSGNFMIVKEKPGKWYICLPKEREKPIINTPAYQCVFNDPGVRSFQTLYSPEGFCGKINVSNRLKEVAKKHDKLHSMSSKSLNSKTKSHIKRRMATLRHVMKNIVNDLHWQTCSFLCKNFKQIVIPHFGVSEMVNGSPLGSTITRKMLQLSHGNFRERLIWYGASRGNTIRIVTEEYTTKTCGSCGTLQNMDGLKVYNCSSCGTVIDRDYNGARNICLKTLTEVLHEEMS